MDSILLRGLVTGRSHANGPVDPLGNPVEHSHDRDVTLTVAVYTTHAHPSELRLWFGELARGVFEIGDEVTVSVTTKAPAVEGSRDPIAPPPDDDSTGDGEPAP